MHRYLAPAGSPISARDLLSWLGMLAGRREPSRALQAAIAAAVGAGHCFTTCTGRAALTVILRALRRVSPDRREVVIPGYTCYSVAASVVRAGLTPRVADVSPDTLDYSPAALAGVDFHNVLAVVATNLYGLPSDLAALRACAHPAEAYVVDDAAQALGARVGGRASGTLGDVGLYSFDKGKNISAIDGGAIVTSDERLAGALKAETEILRPAPRGEAVHALVKLAAYVTLLHPRVYWIPNGIPQLGLGQTKFDTEYAITRTPRSLAALALVTTRRLDAYTAARRANAAMLLAGLSDADGFTAVTPRPSAEPAYLRLPVLARSGAQRDAALRNLNNAGVGATGSYPTAIVDIPALRERLAVGPEGSEGARDIAARILTLPTHPYVQPSDVARMLSILRSTPGPVAPAADSVGERAVALR